MSSEITRRFDSIFSLDTSKLARLLDIIGKRLAGPSNSPLSTFEIATKNGKNLSSKNVDDILNHDNPVNNPITELIIKFKDKADNPDNECSISYDKVNSVILVKVRADDAKKGNELFAEIEEQIERALETNWVNSIKKMAVHEAMFMMLSLIMLPLMLYTMTQMPNDRLIRNNDGLSATDIAQLQKISTVSESLDKKMDFVYQYHIRKLTNAANTTDPLSDLKKQLFTTKAAVLILPVAVVLGGLYYIVRRTYVGSIFLWGDFVDYCNKLNERRKFVWNAVVVSMVIGIIGNLFVFGFSAYL